MLWNSTVIWILVSVIIWSPLLRLKPIDITFMKMLHTKVNIVPVIAKADCLTKFEVQRLKRKVSTKYFAFWGNYSGTCNSNIVQNTLWVVFSWSGFKKRVLNSSSPFGKVVLKFCLPRASHSLQFLFNDLILTDNLTDPLSIGKVRIKSYLARGKIYLAWTTWQHLFLSPASYTGLHHEFGRQCLNKTSVIKIKLLKCSSWLIHLGFLKSIVDLGWFRWFGKTPLGLRMLEIPFARTSIVNTFWANDPLQRTIFSGSHLEPLL